MIQRFLNLYKSHTLNVILIIGLIFRMIAVVFSEGFAFQDDHFLVIEIAQHWVEGIHNDWLPAFGAKVPGGHSFFYAGLHYYFFEGLKLFGITNPELIMFLVRLIHAIYSMTIIYYGFKIAKIVSTEKTAITVGWLLSIFWIFPLLSVRNLVEVVSIPPIMFAVYMLLKHQKTVNFRKFVFIGFIAGISFSFRFQTILILGGIGLVLLIQKELIKALQFGLGVLLSIALFQGVVDYLVWGKPFAEFLEYTNYNLNHSAEYPNGPWYNYTLLILGLFIVPLSLYLFYGNVYRFKKYLLLSLPAAIFFIFHSYFPNKQERFILTMLPFFIIVGVAGWNEFVEKSLWWQKRIKLYQRSWKFVWILNTILLLFLTPASTKVSKLRVMNYFRERGGVEYFALETTHMWGSVLMPRFYHGVWNDYYTITQENSAKQIFEAIRAQHKPLPTHIIFAEPKDLSIRMKRVQEQVKGLVFEKMVESSYLDRFMVWLNPVNVNQTYYIYRIVY